MSDFGEEQEQWEIVPLVEPVPSDDPAVAPGEPDREQETV